MCKSQDVSPFGILQIKDIFEPFEKLNLSTPADIILEGRVFKDEITKFVLCIDCDSDLIMKWNDA
jgi:hypothetical protein